MWRQCPGVYARVKSGMDVTPLIDVLLVLLVIFMAALPLTQNPGRHRHRRDAHRCQRW